MGLVAAEGLCGLEVVEVSPPYDTSDITALVGVRVVVEALGSMVAHGKLGSHKKLIDKPVPLWSVTMHQGHDHDHHHHGNGAAGAGHNHAQPTSGTVQWQTPHLPHDHEHDARSCASRISIWWKWLLSKALRQPRTRRASCGWRGFRSRRPTRAGNKLVMLRVESDAVTDVGALMPQLGGGAMRYDPLPARMVTHRRRLRFIYFDGGGRGR